jgi:hypothetical protein
LDMKVIKNSKQKKEELDIMNLICIH